MLKYKVRFCTELKFETVLNDMAALGWSLVSFAHNTEKGHLPITAVFVRRTEE